MHTTTATVIAIGNQKGGVGKTTNCVHLAAALGSTGDRCLVIDLDPAAGATKHLGVQQDSYAGSLELLTTDESPENFVITAGMPDGVHLIPSRTQLAEIETLLSKFADRTRLFEPVLPQLRATYDYILLDTGPSAGFATTVAAYCAAEWFLLSAFPHPLSMGGLTEAFRDIGDVRRHRNPNLEILGVIFTNVDRRARRLRARLETVVARLSRGGSSSRRSPRVWCCPPSRVQASPSSRMRVSGSTRARSNTCRSPARYGTASRTARRS
ncbi:MAG: ParA family protein [Phycisphaerales bacterium]